MNFLAHSTSKAICLEQGVAGVRQLKWSSRLAYFCTESGSNARELLSYSSKLDLDHVVEVYLTYFGNSYFVRTMIQVQAATSLHEFRSFGSFISH